MANRLFSLARLPILRSSVRWSSHSGPQNTGEYPGEVIAARIGNREVVGWGYNGQISYMDRVDFPMPAIRFREETPDIKMLREKEKGDWKKLSIAEKQALYRASFCQTFEEMSAEGVGEWKSVLGGTLFFMSLAVWVYMFFKMFVYNPEQIHSFSEESQKAQLRRMIDIRVNPIEGISSKWDYEKNEWKK